MEHNPVIYQIHAEEYGLISGQGERWEIQVEFW